MALLYSYNNPEEHFKGETTLHDEPRFLNAILESHKALVMVLDKTGAIEQFNQACEQATGYLYNKVKRKKAWEFLFSPDETNPIQSIFENSPRKDLPKETTNYCLTKNGEWKLIEWSHTLLLNCVGELDSVVCLGTDITAQTALEKSLKESQRFLSTLTANLPGMAFRLRNDENCTLLYASAGSFDLTGYPPEDFITGKIHYGDLIHPDDKENVNIQNAVNRKEPFILHYRITTASGQEKWVWEQGVGVYSDQGELLFLEGFVADTSQFKQAERHNTILKKITETFSQKNHPEEMMVAVLHTVLDQFTCDRAWLIDPCDSEEKTYRVVKEIARPGWGGVHTQNINGSFTPTISKLFHEIQDVNTALWFDSLKGWPEEYQGIKTIFNMKSMLYMSIQPTFGKPWLFGIHHCTKTHDFSQGEIRLFTAIGHEISKAFNARI